MKHHLRDTFATDWIFLSAWRIILRINVAINQWYIRLYRYQIEYSGSSIRLTDLIAELEGDSVRMQMELRVYDE